MAVFGSHEFGLCILLWAQGGSEITTRREDIAGCSAVLLMLSEGLEIELPDFEAEDAMLKGDYLWHEVEIVIGSFPTLLDVHFMCLFMSLGIRLFQDSVSKNLSNPMRH